MKRPDKSPYELDSDYHDRLSEYEQYKRTEFTAYVLCAICGVIAGVIYVILAYAFPNF